MQNGDVGAIVTADASICCCGAGLTPEGNPIPEMQDPSCGNEEAPFQAVLVFSGLLPGICNSLLMW